MFQRWIDDFKDSTGTALRLTSLAAAAAMALFVTTSFLCAAAFVFVLEKYGPVQACLTGAVIFFVVTMIAAICYLVRKNQIKARAEQAAKSTAHTLLADPMLVAAGIQVVRAIGVKRLIPILAVGGLALGLMMSAARRAAAMPRAKRRRSRRDLSARRPGDRLVVGQISRVGVLSSAHVTQRPGSSSLATSVRTLTTGSQATVVFRSPDFIIEGAGRLRASSLTLSFAAGMRTSTEVSGMPLSRNAMVWVCPGASLTGARSALAARLMPVSGAAEATRPMPVRSRPNASCTAPHATEIANAPKTALDICDMAVCPSPHWRSDQQRGSKQPGSGTGHHLTVYEKICGRRERIRGCA